MRIILRMVRKSRLLDALISRTKQEILAATLLQPERSWYLVELARHLRLQPSSLQRELRLLVEAGILKRRENGNRVYFQADTVCPIFRPLAEILFKTLGVVEALREALHSLKNQIDVAFVYGSVAEAAERSTSDIDLMVIGSASLSAISPLLRDVERQLGRVINPTVYAQDEFSRRLREGAHFLKKVVGKEALFIMGGHNELAKLAAGATSKAAPHQPARNRRSARSR
jgi:DNA-binding transcriptional ArsR family regulator